MITGKYIGEQIAAKGLKQSVLANLLGVHPSQVGRIIKGEREIKAKEIPIIQKFLNSEAPALEDNQVNLDAAKSYAKELDSGIDVEILIQSVDAALDAVGRKEDKLSGETLGPVIVGFYTHLLGRHRK